ncbi:conserved hypothetical protein [Frankia sp. Hr75.2]|nr:conserved hypothetical protein [Frankia sp. Hr75.2]
MDTALVSQLHEVVATHSGPDGWTHPSAVGRPYIEVLYNRQRLHPTLGYRTPEHVERAYQATQNSIKEAA